MAEEYTKVNIDPDKVEEPKLPKGHHQESPLKPWPPFIGVWKAVSRNRALKRLGVRKGVTLIEGFIPKPGVIINGVGMLGKQVLTKQMWIGIEAMLSRQRRDEEVFIRGGKDPVEHLGKYRG